MPDPGHIHVEQFVPHPPSRVWQAPSTPDFVAKWWAPGDIQPVVGHRFSLDMAAWGKQACEITADVATAMRRQRRVMTADSDRIECAAYSGPTFATHRRTNVAKSVHANNLIKDMKAVLKQVSDAEAKFYKKFITENAVPTQSDVTAYENHLKGLKAAAKLLNDDVVEISRTIQFFGGPSDTMISGAETLLKTMKSHLPKG